MPINYFFGDTFFTVTQLFYSWNDRYNNHFSWFEKINPRSIMLFYIIIRFQSDKQLFYYLQGNSDIQY